MARFEWSLQQPAAGGAHSAMVTLLDLYQHSMHVDLKAEALREIERLGKALDDAGETLEEACVTKIEALQSDGIQHIHAIHGQLGAQLRNHHFFNLIRQRILMPGGINSFDLPVYHHWLTQPYETRAALLKDWASAYFRYNDVVREILAIIRNNRRTDTLRAEHGYFEQILAPTDSVQLLQICVPHDLPCYPEVSSGRQRFSIRFFDPKNLSERPGQTRNNITFDIRFCGI